MTPEAHFRATAPAFMRRLLSEFPQLDDRDVAAVFGNAGYESKGLTDDQEDKPVVPGSRGGGNWMQWTGTRRKQLEAFAKRLGLDPNGDEAAFQFLVHELRGAEKASIEALRAATTLNDKSDAFCNAFLRPGVPALVKRRRWSKVALEALRRAAAAPAPRPREERPTELPSTALVTAIQQALLDKGYPQVGQVDGEYGDKTRDAIFSFEADQGLALTGLPTGALLEALLNAPAKAQPEARKDATPADVREKVPEARATFFSKVWALIAGVGAVLGAVFDWVVGNIAEIRNFAQPVLDALGDVPKWVYLGLFAGAAFWLWQKSRKGDASVVAAFQSGERR